MEKLSSPLPTELLDTEVLTEEDYPICFDETVWSEQAGQCIDWRWHPDLEFNVVTRGSVEIYVDDTCLRLTAGQGILKNANVLHRSAIAPGCREAAMRNFILGPTFLAMPQSRIFQKYLAPIQGGRRFRFLTFDPAVPWQGEVLARLDRAWQAEMSREGAFELRLQEQLCAVWRILWEHAGEIPAQDLTARSLTDQVRVKQMLSCIHSRYQDKLTLGQIAAAACVSENTCRTIFRAVTRQSPTEYLLEYRLQQALRLLRTTDWTAEEVGRRCGFGDASYFGRFFQGRMGVSPIRYRKQGGRGEGWQKKG